MKKLPILLVTIMIVLAFAACETQNSEGQTRSAMILTVDSIVLESGAGSLAEVSDSGGITAESDSASITLSNRPKNATLETSPWLGIQLEEYQVTFYRTDGGTAVPNSVKRTIRFTIEFNETLEVEAMTILSAEQKVEYPLWDLAINGYDIETGMPVIQVNVLVEFFGKQISGEPVYAQGWTSISWSVEVE